MLFPTIEFVHVTSLYTSFPSPNGPTYTPNLNKKLIKHDKTFNFLLYKSLGVGYVACFFLANHVIIW